MLLALLGLAAAPTPPQAATHPPGCQTVEVRHAAGQPGRFLPLGRLPPASLYLALDRRIDRCLAPVTVSTSIPAANGADAR